MMPRGARLPLLAACMLLVAACAGPRVRPDGAQDPSLLQRQVAREQSLSVRSQWSLRGRLGVSDGRDGGSGTLEWTQRGDAFRFSVHAPVTGKTWLLTGDARHAKLQGLRAETLEGDNAASLLQRELGWRVPVTELSWWARGMRAPGKAELSLRGDGLPARIVQAGWQVNFLDYDESTNPPLPRKLYAESGNYKVRLAIQRWETP